MGFLDSSALCLHLLGLAAAVYKSFSEGFLVPLTWCIASQLHRFIGINYTPRQHYSHGQKNWSTIVRDFVTILETRTNIEGLG